MQSCPSVSLVGLPTPHSVNAGFFVKNGRIIKSNQSRKFDFLVFEWAKKNQAIIAMASIACQSWIKNGNVLGVDIIFFFKKEKIFTKTKNAKDFVKTIDVNNRLKPALDAVSRLIGVDDKFFFRHLIEKKVGEEEKMDVICYPIKL